jgi:hypothetical protein
MAIYQVSDVKDNLRLFVRELVIVLSEIGISSAEETLVNIFGGVEV